MTRNLFTATWVLYFICREGTTWHRIIFFSATKLNTIPANLILSSYWSILMFVSLVYQYWYYYFFNILDHFASFDHTYWYHWYYVYNYPFSPSNRRQVNRPCLCSRIHQFSLKLKRSKYRYLWLLYINIDIRFLLYLILLWYSINKVRSSYISIEIFLFHHQTNALYLTFKMSFAQFNNYIYTSFISLFISSFPWKSLHFLIVLLH